jgi:hypothetical protein
MSATTEPKIVCGGCQKQYKWKPELAGKKVKCKCGTVVPVPAGQPVAPEPAEDDLYALAEDVRPAATAIPPIQPIQPVAPAAIPPIQPIAPVARGISPIPTPQQAMAGAVAGRPGANPFVAYASKRPQPEVEQGAWGLEGSLGRDLILPIVMILGGTVLNFVTEMAVIGRPFADAALIIGVSTIIGIILITATCFAAMKMLDFSMGAPLQALLKVAAIAIAPDAVGDLLSASIPFGGMLAIALTMGMYFALLWAFFDLDGGEVMIVTTLFWVIQTWVVMLIAFGITGLSADETFSTGGGLGGGGGGGIMVMDGEDKPSTAAELDAEMQQSLADDPGQEARAWLGAAQNRSLYTLPRAEAQQMVEQLYTAGATSVQATGIVEEFNVATNLVVTLPEEKSARKRLFEIEAKFLEKRGAEDGKSEDVGQKHIEFWFDD